MTLRPNIQLLSKPQHAYWYFLELHPGLKPFAILRHVGWTLEKKNSLTNTNYNIILYYLEVFCSNVQISYIWVMQMVFSKVHPACQFYKKQFLFILEKTHASRRLKKIYLLNALAL